ncbi:MAG: DUF4124 domain-containing protein [Mizugakiibacter sp.]|uniref:DUF4124 domain-containing protein n=1 Tax=Mizugakiibacter sp. TaxID=1972610 RepID=UPI0031C09B64|nr:DUF4124 domain-containing protein [Xanthomonadaceae bacterium]
MMRRLLLPIVLMLALPAFAGQVYKWTDAKGTVHYSDAPPPQGAHYSRVRVGGAGAEVPDAAAGTAQAAAPATGTAAAAPAAPAGHVADTPENRAKLCADLQKNMALLESSQALTVDGDGGKQQTLDATQRSQELATARDQYQRYCGR